MQKGLVDSNLLIYLSIAEDMEKTEKVKQFFKESQELAISFQSLREVCSVLLRKYSLSKEQVLTELDLFSDIFDTVQDNLEDLEKAINIFQDYKIPFWDAMLIATAERNGIKTIYTENTKDFEKYKKIKTINPLTE